jgi:hypothetical protein
MDIPHHKLDEAMTTASTLKLFLLTGDCGRLLSFEAWRWFREQGRSGTDDRIAAVPRAVR